MTITRDQMIGLLADWFAWNWTTREKDYDPNCLHIGAYFSQTIEFMKISWVNNYGANEGALDTALDILIHPPDLYHRSYWKTAYFDEVEFAIANLSFVWKWFYPFPTLWYEAMTPLLHNQVTLSSDSIYTTSRELALRMIGSEMRSDWLVLEPIKRDRLYDWLAPLADQWKELTEAEQEALYDALHWLYAEPTTRGRQFFVNLRGIIDPLYVPGIDQLLTKPI